jgi:cation diffusion facilitator CzcD-associated flavoprotein CzcO
MQNYDVTILGAGPYGLSAGAHLKQIKGLNVCVYGEPMEFWKAYMPEGMFLRSPWSASNLSDPAKNLTIDRFAAKQPSPVSVPIPLDTFVNYGLWFQQQAVPELHRQKIRLVEREGQAFRVTSADGQSWISHRVIIAAGLTSFSQRPEVFSKLSPEFVTHASDQRDVGRFQGKRVVVIGAGQSALESAALIHEVGGKVEVLVREQSVHWLGWRARMRKLGPIWRLLYAPTDVGPAGVSRIVAIPNSVKYFPRVVQNKFRTRSLRPAGARWLMDRTKNIPITTARYVTAVEANGDALRLRLSDNTTREVDHVLLGTGYRVNVKLYPFLSPDLIQAVQTTDGFPHLSAGLQSSVPGLHFLGSPAAWSFGPLMYFVAGTEFAAGEVARYIARQQQK